MHLSSITIKGFKSFPERTRLVFSPGVSVIVGPNGSGKSNITDAVLWALGEQSPLTVRGQSMRDMIYAGGEGRGPSRYAEIEVVLATDEHDDRPFEFSEVSIRRRLDRDGEGAYWLNGARARLVDVTELLSDANLGREMHSVISQGRVEEIVNSRPRERRSLVEEAAGLGKHRRRRRRAQLKLERTQDNLDRALDVEREARSRLRPLKRQAQAADIHARLEREAGELRARLVASELRAHAEALAAAEGGAVTARQSRDSIEADLAKVNRRRTAIEETLAARDRERTEAWGRLTAIRAAHERLTVRAEALAQRRGELAAELAGRREALGALADEIEAGPDEPVDALLAAVGEALDGATEALSRARDADDEELRSTQIAAVRSSALRAATAAERAEELLAERRQGSLEAPVAVLERTLTELDELIAAVAGARDATGERAAGLEDAALGGESGDDVGASLRKCSMEEADLQGRLRGLADSVTEAEVRAAQLRDRHREAGEELARIGTLLGREIPVAKSALDDSERLEIERGLDRLGRRREQLGPVNPLAEREYEEALAHVEELTEQREDLEKALAELAGLIAETDRKIEAAFNETFDAAQRNFEELISHLFPGGGGACGSSTRTRRGRCLAATRPRSLPRSPGSARSRPISEPTNQPRRTPRRPVRPSAGSALRSRSRRRARRCGSSRCSPAARRRWLRSRSCSRCSSRARRRSTSSTRSRRRSTTPTSTASCSSSAASPRAPSSSSSPTRSAPWTRPTCSTGSRWGAPA